MANNLNMIEILKAGLEKEVKKHILESLVKEHVKSFEADFRDKLIPMIDRITFEGIESIRDHMKIRDELRVLISVDGVINESVVDAR